MVFMYLCRGGVGLFEARALSWCGRMGGLKQSIPGSVSNVLSCVMRWQPEVVWQRQQSSLSQGQEQVWLKQVYIQGCRGWLQPWARCERWLPVAVRYYDTSGAHCEGGSNTRPS